MFWGILMGKNTEKYNGTKIRGLLGAAFVKSSEGTLLEEGDTRLQQFGGNAEMYVGHLISDVDKSASIDKTRSVEVDSEGRRDALYYKNMGTKAIVMTPSSDRAILGNPMLTSDIFKNLGENTKKDLNSANTIIFPIAESRNILGIFKRNHWVTVHYDKATHTATLLDSRPRYASILYPTSSMEKMIRNGLESVLGVRNDKKWQFKEVNQGVQYNDTHCGAWTAANVACLATGATIEVQKQAFKRADEQKIVSFNADKCNWKNNTVENKTFLQKLKEFFSPTSKIDNKPQSSYSEEMGALGGMRVGDGINGSDLYQQSSVGNNHLATVSPDPKYTNAFVKVDKKDAAISQGDNSSKFSSETKSLDDFEIVDDESQRKCSM